MAAVAFITVPDDYPHVKDFEEDHCGDINIRKKNKKKYWPEYRPDIKDKIAIFYR